MSEHVPMRSISTRHNCPVSSNSSSSSIQPARLATRTTGLCLLRGRGDTACGVGNPPQNAQKHYRFRIPHQSLYALAFLPFFSLPPLPCAPG